MGVTKWLKPSDSRTQLIEARVRSALGGLFDMGITSSSIGVQVEDGKALLSGALALLRSLHPALSAFPDMAVRSACALSFSRFAGCSPALRPARSRCHRRPRSIVG